MPRYCTLSDLKTRLNIDQADTTHDARLNQLINIASTLADRYANRVFEYDGQAEDIFDADEREIVVTRYPIESVSEVQVRDDVTDAWSIADVSIEVPLLGKAGVVHFNPSPGIPGQLARITYSGGFILPDQTPQPGQYALPEDIQYAVCEQAAWMWENQFALRMTDRSAESAAASADRDIALIAISRSILDSYKRLRA